MHIIVYSKYFFVFGPEIQANQLVPTKFRGFFFYYWTIDSWLDVNSSNNRKSIGRLTSRSDGLGTAETERVKMADSGFEKLN